MATYHTEIHPCDRDSQSENPPPAPVRSEPDKSVRSEPAKPLRPKKKKKTAPAPAPTGVPDVPEASSSVMPPAPAVRRPALAHAPTAPADPPLGSTARISSELTGMYIQGCGEMVFCRLDIPPPSQRHAVNYVPVNRVVALGNELIRIHYEQPADDPWRLVFGIRLSRAPPDDSPDVS